MCFKSPKQNIYTLILSHSINNYTIVYTASHKLRKQKAVQQTQNNHKVVNKYHRVSSQKYNFGDSAYHVPKNSNKNK